jgi:hypothetical protein
MNFSSLPFRRALARKTATRDCDSDRQEEAARRRIAGHANKPAAEPIVSTIPG